MQRLIPIAMIMAVLAVPALAGHPGERLDEVTAGKEPAFEAISGPAPDLDLVGADGQQFDLADLAGQIVVVNLRPSGCLAPCRAQHDRLAQTVASLNASPMREMVRFITIADRPDGIDTLGADNWSVAAPVGALEVLEARLASRSERNEEPPMLHLFDRDGRHVAIFHGTDFAPLNLLLHINGLTNAHPRPEPGGLLDRAIGWFR
ncbi:redoxin domain-containing protein [Rhodobacteraceae bacterium 2CG4]|uniref:Redoxin domain-containing protein n=1 Tax=Halovulum marinum TaxID=2662447 RepID=A0A6L5Z2P9_9RHOB|nr:redoxin domain-containing protein [Halovulum marinum]MSU90818.1 redoxin domain-containing protein [Halovulum marinum]